jgi:carboxyl-terminal processing protease
MLMAALVLSVGTAARADGDPQGVVDLRGQAERLEQKQQWLAAADVYAELVRRQPGILEWQKHILRCRQQAQLTRRYLDPTLQQRLGRLTTEKALDVYGEVLLKIENHYVSEVDLNRLVSQGLENLDLALQNVAFLNGATYSHLRPEATTRHRAALRERWSRVGVEDRSAAIRKVHGVAIGLQQDVGVFPVAVVLEFISAACEALDEYGAYLPPERFSVEELLAQTDVAGIGIDLKQADDRLLIAAVVPDSAAARAGLQVNEEITRIDDVPVQMLSVEDALLRLFGREGTVVSLEIQRPMEMRSRRVEVPRQRLSVPSVGDARVVDMELNIGYIHIAYFSSTTLEEFDLAAAKLAMLGMRALILDLRGNPGGPLEAAVSIADRFISTGVIVTTRGRSPGSSITYRTQDDRDLTVPLVVLIDGDSASASEVVAGAIKDHRRGLLVGQRSYGKGTVQQVFPLKSRQGGVRLTTAKFYSPLDTCYNEQGVPPDIRVESRATLWPFAPALSPVEVQRQQFEAALRAARELVLKPL